MVSQPGKRERKNNNKRRKDRSLQTELVFLDDSPDYCQENRSQGTLGTTGRHCRYFLNIGIVYILIKCAISLLLLQE